MQLLDLQECARHAGSWVYGVVEQPLDLAVLKKVQWGVGIYLCCRPHGQLHYIGSAVRPHNPSGIAARVLEHPRAKRGLWHQVWLILLRAETPRRTVHAIEGKIIEHWGVPPGNRKRHRQLIVPGSHGR